MNNRDQILEQILNIPALPAAAAQVLHLAQNPDAGISEIMTSLEYDPGLTSDILRLAQHDELSVEDAQRPILGIDHTKSGAALLECLNPPENVVQVVRWHHNPDEHGGDTRVVELAHIANDISASCGLGIGLDELNYRPSQRAIERRSIDHTILNRTTCDMLAALTHVQHHLPGNTEGA